jgi:dehydrogenase/reductase SDR family protein 7B
MKWLIAISIGYCSFLLLRLLFRKRISIRGKTVLITGASSGLGEALARRLFNAQCQLILLARRLDRLENLRDELIKLHPTYPKPHIIQIDLLNFDQITSSTTLMNILQTESIDCLINNAGISQRSSVLDTPIDTVHDIFRLNYLSLVTLTKLILTKIIENKQINTTIVNISSVQGLIAVPDRSSYSASKHAVQAFSDALRMELEEEYPEQNINICVISPSYIRTELGQQAFNRTNPNERLNEDKQSSAYEPDYIAERIIKAIEYREKDVLIAPIQQYVAIWLRRLLPVIFFKMMIARNKRLKARK